MDPTEAGRQRRRRRRRPASGAPRGAAAGPAPSAVVAGPAPAAFDPSGRFSAAPIAPQPAVPAATVSPDASAGPEEQVWERTHLEQTMFQLAREHAEAAARSARAVPPDREGEQTHSLVAVLMSYFALEAFINMVGSDRLGSRFRHYDRMSPEGKWVEVTRLVSKTGKTFAEDGAEMRALSTLRAWRNMLTHYKGEYEDVQQSGRGGETRTEQMLSAENAARAVEIARQLHRAFYERDRRSAPRQFIWLDDRPHRREQQRAVAPGSGAPVVAAQTAAPAEDRTGGERAAASRPRRRRRR